MRDSSHFVVLEADFPAGEPAFAPDPAQPTHLVDPAKHKFLGVDGQHRWQLLTDASFQKSYMEKFPSVGEQYFKVQAYVLNPATPDGVITRISTGAY